MFLYGYWQLFNVQQEGLPVVKVEKKSFDVEVKTIGELEAAQSTIIASSVRGDQGKIIYLIADGVNVKPGDVLVKMDPTPFEEKLDKVRGQIKEQESYVDALAQALEWEKNQAEHENKTSLYEVDTAELELNKLIYGDGPLEIAKLKGAMQKAWLKYDELSGYSNDLSELQEQGFLNPSELRLAKKKLAEEQDVYESTKLQYDSYVNHVYPLLVKKAETHLKKAKIKQEETLKTGGYKIGKALASLEQGQQILNDNRVQLKEGERELALTEIKAPAPGMVVQREEYRSSQKRKPRLGDTVVKNQAILDLPDLGSMIVKTKVREVDLFKVAIGTKATVEVDAYPKLSFSGIVSSIGVLALTDLSRPSDEKHFEVRIALEKGDERLRPGMTARAVIHAQKIQNSLAVPIHAVFEEQGKYYCHVICFYGHEKRYIEVGSSNEQWMEVKSALKEGECICLINPLLKDLE